MRKIGIIALAAGLLAVVLPNMALARHHPRHAARHHHLRATSRSTSATTSTSTASSDSSTMSSSSTTSSSTPGSSGAGTVVSYSNGTLKIALADGTTVSGTVGERAHIRCAKAADDTPGDGESSAGRGPRSSHDGGGDDDGEGSDGCTLAAGETVLSANLSLTSAGAVWDEVTVVPSTTTTTSSDTTTSSTSTATS